MLMARVGDTVVGMCVCTPHPYPDVGVIVGGSPEWFDMGPSVARLGDPVIFSCGSSTIVSSSVRVFNLGPGVARSGDSVTGCGNGTVIGNSTTMVPS